MSVPEMALVLFGVSLGYTVALVASVTRPDDPVSLLIERWFAWTNALVQALFGPFPDPFGDRSDATAEAHIHVLLYRHVLLASTVLGGFFLMLSQSWWTAWGARCLNQLIQLKRLPDGENRVRRIARIGEGLTTNAAVASGMLLCFGGAWLKLSPEILYERGWSYVRAPALISLIFLFVGYAIAFRYARRRL